MKDKLMIVSAYLFGIPALYFVLVDNKKGYVAYHSAKALRMWMLFFVVFFSLRLLINFVWSVVFWPGLIWLETFSVIVMGIIALYNCLDAAKQSLPALQV